MEFKLPVRNVYHAIKGNAKVRWGQFERDEWFSPGGYEHPLVQSIVSEIHQNKHIFEGRKIYVAGGILEPWHSWDIDIFIEGEWSPTIKSTLEWVASLGFKYGVFVDVKLVNVYADVRLWQDTRIVVNNKNYIHSLDFYRDGEKHDIKKDYVPYKDIFVTDCTVPIEKNVELDSLGHRYAYGIRIL